METTRSTSQSRRRLGHSAIRRFARYDLPVLRPSMSRPTLLRVLRTKV
jgi:hypothetical protein